MPALNRNDKVTVILEIIKAAVEHHDSIRDLFADLSDDAINKIYDHTQTIKPHFESTVYNVRLEGSAEMCANAGIDDPMDDY